MPKSWTCCCSQPGTLQGREGKFPAIQQENSALNIPTGTQSSLTRAAAVLGVFPFPKHLEVSEVAVERWARTSNPSSAFLCKTPQKAAAQVWHSSPSLFECRIITEITLPTSELSLLIHASVFHKQKLLQPKPPQNLSQVWEGEGAASPE